MIPKLEYSNIQYQPATKGVWGEPQKWFITLPQLNISASFATEKQAKSYYSKLSKLNNLRDYYIFHEENEIQRIKALLKNAKDPIIKKGLEMRLQSVNTPLPEPYKLDFWEPIVLEWGTLLGFKEGELIEFEHTNFGEQIEGKVIIDKVTKSKLLGWYKDGGSWVYGDLIYRSWRVGDNWTNAAIGSGEEPVTILGPSEKAPLNFRLKK